MRLIDATPFSFNKVVIPDGDPNFMRGYGLGAKHVCDEIDAEPTVDAAPVKHGQWFDAMVGELPVQVCDQCNTFFPLAYTGGGHHYCPNCGAKMDMEEKQNGTDKT